MSSCIKYSIYLAVEIEKFLLSLIPISASVEVARREFQNLVKTADLLVGHIAIDNNQTEANATDHSIPVDLALLLLLGLDKEAIARKELLVLHD